MKAINKDDLIIVLNAIKDRSTLDLDDIRTLFNEFGYDYFIEDGRFVKSAENESMAVLRNVDEFRPASKIIEEQEERIKDLRKNVKDLMYQLEVRGATINELQRKIEDKDDHIADLTKVVDTLKHRLENGGYNMNELTFLQAKKAKADILALLKAHDLKFDISCDHKLMRYVITLIKEVNNREYKISFSCPYHMYDLLQDSVKVDYIKDAILSMIQLLNERIEKWPDEDTEIIYDYVGRISSHENVNE